MKHILSLCMLLIASTGIYAKHTIRLSIKSREEKQPLAGATAIIKSINKTALADSAGIATFANLAAGTFKVTISYVGLAEKEISVTVPTPTEAPLEVLLQEGEEHEHEVVVTATRTSRTISDIPTRVETISGEELAEKGNMKPGDIRMLLNESTGIQTQQTSATSYNSSIRIQGLDGRYTQILRDGFPLYSGFSGGLSLMQVTPLDLKQIEVIKGSSSTLYGGGAIAGLVNLVSKTPTAKKELTFLGNGTSAGGLDLSGFYSQKFEKIGITVFGSRNTGRPYDPAKIGLTAIPKFDRYTINPRLFIYGDKTTANIGFSYISEDRLGGSTDYIKKGSTGYFEKNNTERFTTQAQLTHKINDKAQMNFKNSYSRFNRFIQIPSYAFKGLQQSTYSEATYSNEGEKAQWVIGANLLTDDFAEDKQSNNALRNYHYNTIGAFVQNTWLPTKQFTLETGLRGDYVKQYSFELLPRVSAMLKVTPKLTARLGGGLGYKTPTVFNEDAEKIQFQNILPINQNTASNERSAGGNFDINYRTKIGEVGLAANQLFFYTRLNRPLVLTTTPTNQYEFINTNGHIDTKGMETNLRFTYDDLKLFIGYTYADVNSHFNNTKSWFPLTAKHRLNNVLMYEKEGKLKIGAEGYFFSPQKLNDGAIGKSYWTFGLMGEKTWKHFALFVNLENITDTRQTKFDTIYTGTITNPTFRDIYAPVDGFVVNGGIKIRL
ncbi:TonB-dependent receptor [Segetibacter koreensis]|uniref:TonB-dependent receptor n=1 Tax=Segetibacter koreensis TaxID=398037 RepID=UPI000475EF27|nr:TonB-dependent receptor [Segetibacter koreensis]